MRINKKPIVSLMLAAILATTLAGFAQTRQAAARVENAQMLGPNMKVTGFKSFNIKPSGGKTHVVFKSEPGTQIVGTWSLQGLVVKADGLEGDLSAGTKSTKLLLATMTGNIEATVTRPSANKQSSEHQTVNVHSSKATFDGEANDMKVTGGVVIDQADPGSSQVLHVTGSEGTIRLSAQGERSNAILDATLDGPVVMNMKGTREEVVDGKPKRVPVHVNGKANKMTFVESSHQITLTGDVTLTGDDPGLLLNGDVSGIDKAVITLTADGQVDNIDLTGNPGKTSITDQTLTGGKGGSKGGGGKKKR